MNLQKIFTATTNSESWKVSKERRRERFAVSTKIGADENPEPTPLIVAKDREIRFSGPILFHKFEY